MILASSAVNFQNLCLWLFEKISIVLIFLMVGHQENGSCTEYEHTYNFNDPSSLPYDPEFGALPLQGQNSQHSGTGGHAPNGHAGGGMGGPPPGLHGNMPGQSGGGGGNMGHMMSNLPPGITHILQVLKQQAQETRDPIMQNLQGMLTNVLVSVPDILLC